MRYDALSLRPGRLFGGRRRRRRLYSPIDQHHRETMAGPVRKECVHRRVRPSVVRFGRIGMMDKDLQGGLLLD